MPATKPATLADPPTSFRSAITRGLASGRTSPVDPTGGDYGAGIIRGFAVITRGEALGHGVFVDREFLRSTVEALNAGDGLRVRFTHPGMSSDGLGRKLGRVRSARLDGDIVRADLHFSKSSHTTPDGDLAAYVMSLAEEDPALFGASIVFDADATAERAFVAAHGGDAFRSPDPLNVKHLPHARLAELRAVDVVDEPAANPGGMFHASTIPAEADAMLSYALGLSDDKPADGGFGIDADRLRGFASRFLASRGLTLKHAPVAAKGARSSPDVAAGGVSSNDRTAKGDAMSQKYRGTPKTGQAFAGVGREFDSLVEAVGIERASFAAGCGLKTADARRLLSTTAGDRLSDHKPDAHLHDQAFASVLGLPIDQFGENVNSGHIPAPDGMTPNKNGVTFRSWRASTIAAWLSSGCPDATGKKNRWMASRVGATPSTIA